MKQTAPKRPKLRKDYLTILCVLSSLAVVYFHCSNRFYVFEPTGDWVRTCIIEALTWFAVPVFYMITGATLMDYRDRYDTKTYFKKRLKKALIPFLLWSLLWFIKNDIYDVCRATGAISIDLSASLGHFFTGSFTPTFWFFIPLFAIYLCIPVLSLIPKPSRQNAFKYIILLGLIFNSFLPLISDMLGIEYNFNFTLASNFLIYPIIGYYLSHYKLEKKERLSIYILGAFSLLYLIIFTIISSFQKGETVDLLWNREYILVALFSSSVFLGTKDLFRHKKHSKVKQRTIKICNFLAPATSGVFILHFFIMGIIKEPLHVDDASVFWQLLAPLLIFIVCIAITKIIQKIPILKHLLPE